MNESPGSLKSVFHGLLRKLCVERPYFSLNAVKEGLGNMAIQINDKTLRNYLSEAMAEKIVHDAGKGWYCSIPTPAALDESHVRDLKELLTERFPFLPHYIWSTLQLNPWMHHLFGKPIHFVHVDAEGEKDMEDFLKSKGWDVLTNPTPKSAGKLVSGEKCVVIRGVRREIDAATEPTVGTVLAEALLENARLHFMDESERKEMSLHLIREKRINIASIISRLQKHDKTLVDLAGKEILVIISEF